MAIRIRMVPDVFVVIPAMLANVNVPGAGILRQNIAGKRTRDANPGATFEKP